MTGNVQYIALFKQEEVPDIYLDSAVSVINSILDLQPAQQKYRAFIAQGAQDVVNAWVALSEVQSRHDGHFPTILQNRARYYQLQAYKITEQMDAFCRRNPNIDALMITKDSLYTPTLNFAFGFSNDRLSIVSLGQNSPYSLNPEEFCMVLSHELGHKFGATEYANRSPNQLVTVPNLGTHCRTPGCIMNNIQSANDMRAMNQNNADFCDDCLAAMRLQLSR